LQHARRAQEIDDDALALGGEISPAGAADVPVDRLVQRDGRGIQGAPGRERRSRRAVGFLGHGTPEKTKGPVILQDAGPFEDFFVVRQAARTRE
jgi:hypothetical protein